MNSLAVSQPCLREVGARRRGEDGAGPSAGVEEPEKVRGGGWRGEGNGMWDQGWRGLLQRRRRFRFVTRGRRRGEKLMDKHHTAAPALKGLRVGRRRLI